MLKLGFLERIIYLNARTFIMLELLKRIEDNDFQKTTMKVFT